MDLYPYIFTLSAIGVAVTVYLFRKRRAKEQPVCFAGGECHKVLVSDYSKIFLFHNDTWGLMFYSAVCVVVALLATGIGPFDFLSLLLKIMIGASVIVSLVLSYFQWKVVKAWCSWCVTSSLISFAIAGLVLLSFLK